METDLRTGISTPIVPVTVVAVELGVMEDVPVDVIVVEVVVEVEVVIWCGPEGRCVRRGGNTEESIEYCAEGILFIVCAVDALAWVGVNAVGILCTSVIDVTSKNTSVG